MKISLLTIGEPVPLDANCTSRLHRTGQFALWAAERANVTWWTSGFDHFSKKFIVKKDSEIQIRSNLRIRAFNGCGYRSNVSLQRIADQNQVSNKILKGMLDESERPDIILCSVPPIELAAVALEYATKYRIPVVLDLRDMWPDIFVDQAPKLFRQLARLLLTPMFLQANRVFSSATALIGITDSFVDWGIKKTTRTRGGWDKAFNFAYSSVPPPAQALSVADAYWDSVGILKQDGMFTVCFFGSINRQFDFKTVFKAFNETLVRDKIRLVICGTGDKLEYFKSLAAGQKNVVFAGWVDAAKIYSLMKRSSAGLDPLPERYDFLATINNKAVEYLSAGLPVISCPNAGELYDLLRKTGAGVSYAAGDSAGLASVLAALNDSPQKVALMSAAALKCFKDRFDSQKIHSDMFSHLELIVKEYAMRSSKK